MAKELMEIGGFITSGAEIVNHDNTLSGNGTVDSPLGVVPGYNETVLFDNDSNVSDTAKTSEVITNFEKVKLYFRHVQNTLNNYICYEYPSSSVQFLACGGRSGETYPGTITWFFTSWQIGSDSKTFTRVASKYVALTTSISAPADSTNFRLVKIIGINRKAQ